MLRAFPEMTEMTSLVHSLVEFLARQSKPSQRTMIGGNVRATLYRESSFTACNRHIWDMVSPVKSPRQVATGIFVTLRHCIVDLPVLSSIVGVTTKSDGRHWHGSGVIPNHTIQIHHIKKNKRILRSDVLNTWGWQIQICDNINQSKLCTKNGIE